MFQSIKTWLSQYDEDWIEDNFNSFGDATSEVTQRKQAAWVKGAKRFQEAIFVWYQAGLGRPELLADFGYWSNLARFDVLEITLLSMGFEPAKPLLERFDADKMRRRKLSPADTFAVRRYEMFRRKFAPNSKNASVYPVELVEWVRSVDLDVHPAFLRMIDTLEQRRNGARQIASFGTETKNSSDERPPEGREMASLAKLLTAIAIEEYGYEPKSRRSPIPKEIEAITDRHGLSVSHDTIRKYLRIGASFLPDEE